MLSRDDTDRKLASSQQRVSLLSAGELNGRTSVASLVSRWPPRSKHEKSHDGPDECSSSTSDVILRRSDPIGQRHSCRHRPLTWGNGENHSAVANFGRNPFSVVGDIGRKQQEDRSFETDWINITRSQPSTTKRKIFASRGKSDDVTGTSNITPGYSRHRSSTASSTSNRVDHRSSEFLENSIRSRSTGNIVSTSSISSPEQKPFGILRQSFQQRVSSEIDSDISHNVARQAQTESPVTVCEHNETSLRSNPSESSTSTRVSATKEARPRSLPSTSWRWHSLDRSFDVGSTAKSSNTPLTVPPTLSKFEYGENSSSSSISTRVHRPPDIIIKPRRQFVGRGTTARFRVSFDGHPPPTVAWQRGGVQLQPCDKYAIYESHGIHVLEVHNANEVDQDTYECVIRNDLGSVIYQAELIVYGSPTGLPIRDRSLLSPIDGERPLVLTPNTTSTTSSSTLTATHQRPMKMTSSNVISVRSSSATTSPLSDLLSFSATFPRNQADTAAGTSTEACNGGGGVDASSISLAPVFDRKPKSASVEEGDTVELTYLVRASPAVQVEWVKDGKPVSMTGERFTTRQNDDGSCTLVLDPVLATDAGRYVCVARNVIGEVRCLCSLMVAPGRSVTIRPFQPAAHRTQQLKTAPDSNKRQGLVNRLWNVQSNEQETNNQSSNIDLKRSKPTDSTTNRIEFDVKEGPPEATSSGGRHISFSSQASTGGIGVALAGSEPTHTINKTNEVQLKSFDHTPVASTVNCDRKLMTSESVSGTSTTTMKTTESPRRTWSTDGTVVNGSIHLATEQSNVVTSVVYVNGGGHQLRRLSDLTRQQVTADAVTSVKLASPLLVREIPDVSVETGRRKSDVTNSYSVTTRVTAITSGESSDGRSTTKVTADVANDDVTTVRQPVNFRSEMSITSKRTSCALSTGGCVATEFNECTKINNPANNDPYVYARVNETSTAISAVNQTVAQSTTTKLVGDVNDVTGDVSTDDRSSTVLNSVSVDDDDEVGNELNADTVPCANSVAESSDALDIDDEANDPDEGQDDLDVMSEERDVKWDDYTPPFIEDLLPENVHILRGTTLQLVAQFCGNPLPVVTWFHDNETIVEDDRISTSVESCGRATLNVLRTEPSDTGRYAVELHNEHGRDRMFSSVTIEDRPEPPVGKPAVTSVNRSSVVLSWSGCSYDGGSSIIGYRVELKIEDGTETNVWQISSDCCQHTTLQVHNLQPNTEYRFRISSANKHGYSVPGEQSDVVVTLERKPSLKIANRDCDGGAVERQRSYLDVETSPQMLLGPLSPATLMAIRDEMPFEPHEVIITPGRKFEDFYTRGEEIGRGKFGNVNKCIDKSSGKTYAAKFIRVKAGQREDFRREITVMNELRHPKILLLWDAFESTRELILVMEHVGGRELMERIISEDYELTERECVHFVRQLCEGVAYIHTRNILHLDLKPENILCVTFNSNEIKIIDFGLARQFDPTKSFKVLFGTAEFVAPEVINYDNVGFTTDMWSVGVIAYLLLSGLSPFAGDNDAETLANITEADFDYDAPEFELISDNAKDFIDKLLVKQPKKRMQAEDCLKHRWLSQDVTYMIAKRLSTTKHKKFLARRKWQKTGKALMAISRLTGLQRLSASGGLSSRSSSTGTDPSVRSTASDIGPTTAAKENIKTSASVSGTAPRQKNSHKGLDVVAKSRSLDLKALGMNRPSLGLRTHPEATDLTPPRDQQSGDPVKVDDRAIVGSDVIADEMYSSSELLDKSCSSTADRSFSDDDRLTSLQDDNTVTVEDVCDNVVNMNEVAVAPVAATAAVTSQSPVNVQEQKPDVVDRNLSSLVSPPCGVTDVESTVNETLESLRHFPVAEKKPISADNISGSSEVVTSSNSAPKHETLWSSSTNVLDNLPALNSTSSSSTASSQGPTTLSRPPYQRESRGFAAVRKNFDSAELLVTEGRTGGAIERRRFGAFPNTNSSSSSTSSNSSSSSKQKIAPMFVRKMKNVTVVEGETARFDVLIKANPSPSVVWTKDAVELDVVTSETGHNTGPAKYRAELSEDEGRWTLLVAECGEDDDAEYWCRATNCLGQVSSKGELYVEPAGAGEE